MPRKHKPLLNTKARWRAIEQKYGLSKEAYNTILQEQGGTCFICQRSPYEIKPRRNLSVDHCHTTGEIRGLLCYNCNHRLLGFIIKDNIQMAKRLAQYLIRKVKYGRVPDS